MAGSLSQDNEPRLGTRTRWGLGLSPAVTYFLRDHIGAGLHLGGGISRGSSVDAIRFPVERSAEYVQVGVHGAFDVPIARRLSLLVWPSLAYVHEWSRETVEARGGFSGFGGIPSAAGATFQQQAGLADPVRRYELGYVRCALSALLLFHLSSNVGVGLGTELWLDFIVRREPSYRPGSDWGPDEDVPSDAALFRERPARRRFQVGLTTALVIAF